MSVELGRLSLRNPLMMASGTFGLGDRLPEIYRIAGAFVSKTVTPAPRAGNPPPRIVEVAAGLVNYVGLQNPGIDAFIAMIAELDIPTSLVVSVHATNVDDVELMLGKLEALEGVAGYELNLSCPNVKTQQLLPAIDDELVDTIVSRARAATERWLCAKLPPYSCIAAGPIAERAGADALCLCNTYPAMAFTPSGKRMSGGFAGPAIKPMTLYNVFHTAQRVDIPVIASGGIRTGKDVAEYLAVGAKAVQIGSASFVEPDAVRRILEEWEALSA